MPLLYGVKCSSVKNSHIKKMYVVKMRMLRWMRGHTKRKKIRNEVSQEKVGVASMVNKMREVRLRLFRHKRVGAETH